MKSALTFLLFLFAGLLICCSSCKKKDDQQTAPHESGGPYCRMTSATTVSGACRDSSVISYDDAGRIAASLNFNSCLAVPVSQRRFIYDGGKIYILDTSLMADKDTLIVDAALRILEIHRGTSAVGFMATRFQFSSAGVLQSGITSYHTGPSPAADTTRYVYENGDMVRQTSVMDTLRYSYYTDKEIPATSLVTQYGLRYGSANIYNNKHLLKAALRADGTALATYTYTYDGFGNIATKTGTDNGRITDSTFYRYQCAIE